MSLDFRRITFIRSNLRIQMLSRKKERKNATQYSHVFLVAQALVDVRGVDQGDPETVDMAQELPQLHDGPNMALCWEWKQHCVWPWITAGLHFQRMINCHTSDSIIRVLLQLLIESIYEAVSAHLITS